MVAPRTDERTEPLTNFQIADKLNEAADLLEAQQANAFRVRAYRIAAETVRNLNRPIADVLDTEGIEGLKGLPGVGDSLARSIERLAREGRFALLDQLRGEHRTERLFSTVAGIGPELAARIHEEIGIETLDELQTAA